MTSISNKIERIGFIDLLRVISICAIVFWHSIETPLNYSGPDDDVANLANHLIKLCYWAVPIFFMITGYCAQKKKICSYKYCIKKALRFLAVLFIFGTIFSLMKIFFQNNTIVFTDLFTAFKDCVNGETWKHMWFLYAIIGVYLILPVTHTFVNNGKKECLILLLVIFIMRIFIPFLNDSLSLNINFYNNFSGYLFYVVAGQFLSKYHITINLKIKIILAILVVLLLPFQTGALDIRTSILVLCLFILFSNIKFDSPVLLSTLANCTFGIYLFHPVIIQFFVKWINVDFFGDFWFFKIFLLFLSSFLISFIGTFIIKKIPFLKRLI